MESCYFLSPFKDFLARLNFEHLYKNEETINTYANQYKCIYYCKMMVISLFLPFEPFHQWTTGLSKYSRLSIKSAALINVHDKHFEEKYYKCRVQSHLINTRGWFSEEAQPSNGVLLPKLFRPTSRKIVLVIQKNF